MAFVVGEENQTTGVDTQFWLKPNGGTLTKVGLVLDVPELPSGTRGYLNTTHMETGDYETFMSAPRKDGAEFTITFEWVSGNDGDDVCQEADDEGLPVEYRIVTRKHDGTWEKRDGKALVSNYKILNPGAEVRTAQLTMKLINKATTSVHVPA